MKYAASNYSLHCDTSHRIYTHYYGSTDSTPLSVLLLHELFEWKNALINVRPETFIGWHDKGFRLFWRWRERRPRTARPIGAAVKPSFRPVVEAFQKEPILFIEAFALVDSDQKTKWK